MAFVPPDYRRALSTRSTYVENVLIHRLVAELASALWTQDPEKELGIFNSEVDESGFDLVLHCDGKLRYIQIKQAHGDGRTNRFAVRSSFSVMPGSCVVVIVHSMEKLEINHYLFYGGSSASDPMSSIDAYPPMRGRRNREGNPMIRGHYREVPRNRFEKVGIDGLLRKLFG